MPLFRRKTAEVLRRGVGNESTEERTTRRIGGRTVKVRRVRELPSPKSPSKGGGSGQRRKKKSHGRPKGRQSSPTHRRENKVVPLPLAGRKQMTLADDLVERARPQPRSQRRLTRQEFGACSLEQPLAHAPTVRARRVGGLTARGDPPRKRLSRQAKPWPERPVSAANKSGGQMAARRGGPPIDAVS